MFDPNVTTVTERDTELGRWRWPENPAFVVYVAPECTDYDLRVTCESSGVGLEYRRREDEGGYPATGNFFTRAARAYFAAHPVPKPLPSEPYTAWVDKYGTDIWWVDGAGVLRCCASTSSNPAKYAPFTRLVSEVPSE